MDNLIDILLADIGEMFSWQLSVNKEINSRIMSVKEKIFIHLI